MVRKAGDAGVFRSTEPAWNDRNLQELSAQASSGRVFAHIRASTGSAIQQTNCHPFRHGRWLWMHNGLIADFRTVKRDLTLAVDPELFPYIEGSTDSELLFFLALTFGLEADPPAAVARAVGLVEEVGRRHGVEHPIQMTVATTDGETTWAFRHASDGVTPDVRSTAPTSRHSAAVPGRPGAGQGCPTTRLVVLAAGRPAGGLAGGLRRTGVSSSVGASRSSARHALGSPVHPELARRKDQHAAAAHQPLRYVKVTS